MFKSLKKIYAKSPVLIYDILSILLAWYLAFIFFDNNIKPSQINTSSTWTSFALLALVQIGCYYHFKVYRGLWYFSSLKDVMRILKAVGTTSILIVPILYFTSLLVEIPNSILPLYSIALITLLCSGRLSWRVFHDRHKQRFHIGNVKRVIVVGAGYAGESLIRELAKVRSYKAVGIVDDDVNKIGLELHGVRILGPINALVDIVRNHHADLIFIAIPSARSNEMQRIVEFCEQAKISFRTLPGLEDIIADQVQINSLRKIRIEDLLGREPVELCWDKIQMEIQNKRVLVTGGGGSIGSELSRQIMRLNPEKLMVLDHNEFNLFQIEMELLEKFPKEKIELALVSVTDSIAINHIFQTFKPEIVFHAAAYKHVPLLEDQIRIAIQNNVLGTQLVAHASVEVGVKKFILISTDKAVNPTNIMGSTKRVAEIYCQNLNSQVETQFITVRFGNVLGSAGSVVPLFQMQLKNGGPLTVTHPEIERYFMTIAEACQLILQATANGSGGEIFVLDMGKPVKISYLAEQMIRLAGKEPGVDIEIHYTGLRAGEKLYEELFHESEELKPTDHAKLFKAKFRHINWRELNQTFSMLKKACAENQTLELLVLLKTLVPEFQCEPICYKEELPIVL